MDHPPEKIRQHYERQALSSAVAERILATGREEGRERFRRRAAVWAMAAMLAMAAVFFAYRQVGHGNRPIETRDIEVAMQAFFAQPEHPIARVSGDLPELRTWLARQGAPVDAVVPASFSRLPAFGCHVLNVGQQSVYLLCFILEAGNEAGATDAKKSPTLVHFLSVPVKAFKFTPTVGAPVTHTGEGEWKFVEWRSGDVVYIAAGEVSAERLQRLVASL